jgi:hypothetical protein
MESNDIEHLLRECRTEALLDTLGIKSVSGRTVFYETAKKWNTSVEKLQARSEAWRRLKQIDGTRWESHVSSLLANESILRESDPSTASDSQKEEWSQILFTGEWSCLNFIPFLLMYVAISKIFLAPFFAWCMPAFTLFLPFLVLKFMYKLPITWGFYWNTMKPMILGSLQGAMEGDLTVTSLIQYGGILFSYAQGMYIPYTNAKHCYEIDQRMLHISKTFRDTLTRLRDISAIWKSYGITCSWNFPDPATYGDERQILAWIANDPQLLPEIYRAIGNVEIMYALQQNESLTPVIWSQSSTPICNMQDAIDPLLSKGVSVPFHLVMDSKQHHVVCTGPNRGGKSTFLRATLTNLMMAHVWGLTFSKKTVLTPVEWIISSLRLEDSPGKESLFEREVLVAGEILRLARNKKSRGWVIIDELFHTTNPPDAATASQIFLQQLWQSNLITSIVSTHLFSHAETAPEHVQKLCLQSEFSNETKKINYTYTVSPGINTMSSVKELLLESKVLYALS